MVRVQGIPAPAARPGPRQSVGVSGGWVSDSRFMPAVALMVVVQLFYMAVPAAMFDGSGYDLTADPNQNPNLLYRAIKLGLLLSGLLIFFWRLKLVPPLLRELNAFFLGFLALVLASSTWSIEPGFTLTRFLSLCVTSFVCFAFVLVGWHQRRFQNVVRPVLTLLLAGSLVLGLLAPDMAKEHGTGISLQNAWRGLFSQKNGLGQAATLGGCFWLHAWLAKETKFWKFLMGFGVSLACLLLSRSSTSLFSALFVSVLLLLLLRGSEANRRYMGFIVTVFAATLLVYSLAVLNIVPGLNFILEPIVAFTGKDLTFSGRTQVWAVIREHIKLAPLLGTGYGAYWIGPVPSSPSYVFISRYSNFYPTVAHNGYLDIINDLGYVGLMCLMGYLFVYLRQSLALLKLDFAQGALYLALLFEGLINNLTETNWLFSSNFSFAIMTLATFALARAALERRLRVPPNAPTRTMAAPGRRMQSMTSR